MKLVLFIEKNFNEKSLQDILLKKLEKIYIWDPSSIVKKSEINLLKNKISSIEYLEGKLSSAQLDDNIIFFSNDIINLNEIIRDFIDRYKELELDDYEMYIPFSSGILNQFNGNIKNIDIILKKFFKRDKIELNNIYYEKMFYIKSKFFKVLNGKREFIHLKDLFLYIKTLKIYSALLLDEYIIYKENNILYDINEKNILNLFRLISMGSWGYLDKKNILYIIHADFYRNAENNVGGTQYHLRDLVSDIKNIYNVFVLSKDRNGIRLTLYTNDYSYSIQLFLEKSVIGRMAFCQTYRNIYNFILSFFNIDLVHVHHTINLSIEIYREASRRNLPIILTGHDYYYLCPLIKMSCNKVPEEKRCNECIQINLNLPLGKNYWKEWRYQFNYILEKCNYVIVPTESAKKVFTKIYIREQNKFKVIEHGIKSEYKIIGNKLSNPLNVAFIGGLTEEKGSKLILDIISKDVKNINWHIFGGIADKDLLNFSKKNVFKYGWYEQNNIVDLLREKNIHIVCIFSLWKETYCYTLTESLLAGIPTIVTPLGALKERVEKLKCGWILSDIKNNAVDIINLIYEIQKKPEEYQKICDNIKNIKWQTIQNMTYEYSYLYNGLISKDKKVTSISINKIDILKFLYRMIPDKTELTKVDLNEILTFRDQIYQIKSKKIWHILTKFNMYIKKIMNKG